MALKTLFRGSALTRPVTIRQASVRASRPASSLVKPAAKPSFTDHKKFSAMWWKDVAIVGTVFSITGSCSMALVRPAINGLGIEGSMKEGPWTYRAAHLTVSPPAWCAMLVTIGTCFGKRQYFSGIANKVMSRYSLLGKVPAKLLARPVPKLAF
ncbi:hypothetical protein DSO57_1038047 [Entomophthora muscae]|uniref:Uncharacterized protein n=2 Tax=Entomophthora muscae TaxID=34485 RepID=A0ACC2UJ54_9FUNG|nr:hypothetical protein DSO57_1022951 [Entomophthora muscae]KAJ9086962.1 hypothetical protein DSO57_1038047 [Entomophthora muscae]